MITLTTQEHTLLQHILEGNRDPCDGPDTKQLFEKLYEHYVHDMPYGTAKARTGDPEQWIIDTLEQEGWITP